MIQNIKKSDPVKSVLAITVGFLVIYLIGGYKWSLIVSITVGLLGLLSGALAYWIDKGWMKLAALLGLIVPNIILTAVFYLVLTPIALLFRLMRKDDALMLVNKNKSTLKATDKIFTERDFNYPW